MNRIADIQLQAVPQKPTSVSVRSTEQDLLTPFQIGKLLVVLAQARQTTVDPETLRIFSKPLQQRDPRDVRSALGGLATKARREGETAFPDLGTVLQTVSTAERERLRTTRERKILSDMDASKVQWLRERAEDIAQGIERKPLSPELRDLAQRLGLPADAEMHEGELRAA